MKEGIIVGSLNKLIKQITKDKDYKSTKAKLIQAGIQSQQDTKANEKTTR